MPHTPGEYGDLLDTLRNGAEHPSASTLICRDIKNAADGDAEAQPSGTLGFAAYALSRKNSMPKRRRTRTAENGVTKRIALNERIRTLQKQIIRLKREQAGVSRDEFVEVVTSVRQLQRNTDDIAKHTSELATQLTRMGQIQAEVDDIKRALRKAKLLDGPR